MLQGLVFASPESSGSERHSLLSGSSSRHRCQRTTRDDLFLPSKFSSGENGERNLGSSDVFAVPGFQHLMVVEEHDSDLRVHSGSVHHLAAESDDCKVCNLCTPIKTLRKESE